MIYEQTEIDGLFKVSYKLNIDKRGESVKLFCADDVMKKSCGKFIIDEVFYSYSQKNVIRGMHMQNSPYAQEKIIFVLSGSIKDVILDLRSASDKYGSYKEFTITPDSFGLLIPRGCAHGFMALEDSQVLYLINGQYKQDCESGIRWDSFGYEWKAKLPIISDKDLKLPTFADYKKHSGEISILN